MTEINITCKRCKRQRASGIFRIESDKKTVNKFLCADCGFKPHRGTRHTLIKSLTAPNPIHPVLAPTPYGPFQKSPDYFRTREITLSAPGVYQPKWRPYKPNFLTGPYDPNPSWLR